jgi:hypothetical protein
MNQELSVAKGIQIQNEHLQKWKTILKEEVYEKLALWTMEKNLEANTGYDIRRGSDLSAWVQNYSIDNKNSIKVYL